MLMRSPGINPLAFCLGLLAACSPLFAEEPETESTLRYKMSWSSTSVTQIGAIAGKSQSDTVIVFTRRTRGHEVSIGMEDMQVRSVANGQVTFACRVNRSGYYLPTIDGSLQKVPDDQLGPVDKTLVSDGFGKPFLYLKLDESGKEVSRSVAQNTAAKIFHESGMDTNCTFFHAPYDPNAKTWKNPISYRLPGGGRADGEFTLSIQAPSGAQSVTLNTSGQLKAPELNIGDPHVLGKNYLFEGQGQQTYDLKRKVWVGGSIKGPVSFEAYKDGVLEFTSKGTLEFKLELLETDPDPARSEK